MTYVRWAAIDAFKAEQELLSPLPSPPIASTSTSNTTGARPITPPNEVDLERERTVSRHATPVASTSTSGPTTTTTPVPRTPTANRSGIVPGQPRKTPGKTKHSVASPEVRDRDEEDGFEEMDDLMLVKDEDLTPEEEDELDPLALVPAPTPTTSSSKAGGGGGKVPTRGSTRPTRIARAARPLSAITDNRIVDLGFGAADKRAKAGAGGGAVKNLATLFETGAVSGAGGYNLRGGRTSPVGGSSASPSRLPTRVGAAGAAGAASGLGVGGAAGNKRRGGTESCMEVVGSGIGRSVRRRRSSLGSTDVRTG